MFTVSAPDRTATTPATHTTDPFTSPASSHTEFHTPKTSPQPNFPHPPPTSWLVFALPKAHCTTYPTRTEDFNLQFNKNTITKRTDLDLSHSGLPIFEFSPKDKEKELSTWSAYIESLTLGLPPNASGKELDAINSEIERLNGVYADGAAGNWLSVDERGATEFNEGLVKEVEKWQGIRGAMGRGKLRIVVRWTESTFSPEEEDFEMGGMGMEESGGLIKRTTRSEARKRSVLGAEMMRMGAGDGLLMGVGMPSRTRAGTGMKSAGGSGLAETVPMDEDGGGVQLKSPEKKKQIKKKPKGRKR
jgi:hypothetical protein